MASVVIEVPCGEEMHRIELRDDGTAKVLDHNPRVVAAFTRMGATPPECARAVAEYEKAPLYYILSIIVIDKQTLGLLLCDYAEHVLPIFRARIPRDDTPRATIETARAFWNARATRQEVANAAEAAEEVANLLSPGNPAEPAAWAAARAARFPVQERRANEASRCGIGTVWAAEEAAAWAAGWSARTSERAWQLEHTIKVLKALEEGRPWPAL